MMDGLEFIIFYNIFYHLMSILEAIKDSRVKGEFSNSGMFYWLFFTH